MAPRVRKAIKILASLFGAIVLLIVLALVLISTPYFASRASGWLSDRSGRHIAFEGRIETKLFSKEPRFSLSNVKVGNAEWSKDPSMFEAKRIEFSIRPLELLRGRLIVPTLIMEEPVLILEKNMDNKANWQLGQNPQALALKQPLPERRSEIPMIQYLKIADGKFIYRDPIKHIETEVAVSTISGEGKGEDIHVSGKGLWQNEPFLIDLTGASVLQLRESSQPYPLALKITIGDTSAEVEGTVKDPIRMEAFDVALKLKGANAADLFPILGISLPPTPRYQVIGQLKHERENDEWHFKDFSGTMGTSDLKGDIAWHPDQEPPYLEGSFVSENLDMADMAGFIGANKKPDDENRVLPDTQLDISRLMAMNADVSFRGKRVKDTQILNDFYMKIELKDGVLHLNPLSFGIAGGTLKADIVVEGRKEPPMVTLDVGMRKMSLNQFFEPLAEKYGKENVSAGVLGGKAKLQGTGKSLRDMLANANGDIVMGIEGGQLSRLLLNLVGLDLFRAAGLVISGRDEPVPLHCVIAYFAVEDGIMQTRQFLIDTDVTSIGAEGGISLRDETIDMVLHTSPKQSSLLSAHSPIEIRGTLKKPRVGVNKMAILARGGIAAALGALAPPAALLAFLEPASEEEESMCYGFIQQIRAAKAEGKDQN